MPDHSRTYVERMSLAANGCKSLLMISWHFADRGHGKDLRVNRFEYAARGRQGGVQRIARRKEWEGYVVKDAGTECNTLSISTADDEPHRQFNQVCEGTCSLVIEVSAKLVSVPTFGITP